MRANRTWSIGCAGDVPTMEALAAVELIRRHLPALKVRFINVVDLMRLQHEAEHPHGLSDREYDALFTPDKPIIFAYHGYPWLIHRLTYRRTNHANLHVRGYKEEGTVTTPFDMVMRNDLDRFHLVMDVIDRVPGLGAKAAQLRQEMVDERVRSRAYAKRVRRGPRGHPRLESGPADARRRRGTTQSSSSTPARVRSRRRSSSRPMSRWGEPRLLGRRRLARHRPRLGAPGCAARSGSAAWVEIAAGLEAVAYRVVHGGPRFTAATVIDDAVVDGIVAVADLAPLHNDVALETIAAGRSLLPDVPHVACFDTAYHATLEPAAYRYPVPERWYHRVGYPPLRLPRALGGLVSRSGGRAAASRRRGPLAGGRAPGQRVLGHGGARGSVGRDIDGTDAAGGSDDGHALGLHQSRGALPPGRTRALACRRGQRPARPRLGIARRIGQQQRHARAAGSGRLGDERASLAISMFEGRAAAWIAHVATGLPRLDVLVFTGGIGENATGVRRHIVERLAVLGLSPLPNRPLIPNGDNRLNGGAESVAVLGVEAREDLVMAAEAAVLVSRCLPAGPSPFAPIVDGRVLVLRSFSPGPGPVPTPPPTESTHHDLRDGMHHPQWWIHRRRPSMVAIDPSGVPGPGGRRIRPRRRSLSTAQ